MFKPNTNLIWNFLLKSYQFFSKCQLLLMKSRNLWLCNIEDFSLQSSWILDGWGAYLLLSHVATAVFAITYSCTLTGATSMVNICSQVKLNRTLIHYDEVLLLNLKLCKQDRSFSQFYHLPVVFPYAKPERIKHFKITYTV